MATAPVVTAAPGRPVVGAPSRSSSPSLGLWYGNRGTSSILPTTAQLIQLYLKNHIQKMWLCCDAPEDGQDILEYIKSHREAIKVVLCIPTPGVRRIAQGAMEWIELITTYQPVISYVCLGNVGEMNNKNDIPMIGSAMDIIHHMNSKIPIKASTLVDVNSIFGEYDPTKPPSGYKFDESFRDVLPQVFKRLVETSSPLFVKTFPNCAFRDDDNIRSKNYRLDKNASPYMTDHKNNLKYRYVFDAMVDSISCAIDAMGFSKVDISVVSGWPTAGSSEATIDNAQHYMTNLLRHVNEDTPLKTKRIDHFIFSAVDEDTYTANDGIDWQHFGTFTHSWNNETFPRTEMDDSAEAS